MFFQPNVWRSKDKVRTKRGVVSIFQRTLGTPDIHQRWMGREGSSGRRRRNRRRVSFFFFTPTSRFFSFLFLMWEAVYLTPLSLCFLFQINLPGRAPTITTTTEEEAAVAAATKCLFIFQRASFSRKGGRRSDDFFLRKKKPRLG